MKSLRITRPSFLLPPLLAAAALLVLTVSQASAFAPVTSANIGRSSPTTTTATITTTQSSVVVLFVGGKGWENNDYLDSLGGNQEDRKQAREGYEEFHKSRQDFLKRQQERMNTPQGKKFMEQQQQQQQQGGNRGNSWLEDGNGDDEDEYSFGGPVDDYDNIGESSGGSRLRDMMQKAKQRQRQQQRGTGAPDPYAGLQQKFIVPLDDEDEENKDEYSGSEEGFD